VDEFTVIRWLTFLLCWTTQANAITVIDDTNRQVEIPAPAERIVALAPHIVENLFAVGLGDRIVGAVQHSDYPAEARTIPIVGGFNSLNIEAILALNPDLIVTWGTGNNDPKMARLAGMGFPIYVSEPNTLKKITANLKDFAVLGGSETASLDAAADFERKLDAVPIHSASSLTVLYQIWNDPIQTLNGQHIANEILERCGLRNLFAKEPTIAPILSLEGVLSENPEVIIGSGFADERPEWLDRWRQFRELRAVRNNALWAINPDFLQRPTTRILEGLQNICALTEALRSEQAADPLQP